MLCLHREERVVSGKPKKERREPTPVVEPFAWIRIIVAVIIFVFALAAIGYRAFFV